MPPSVRSPSWPCGYRMTTASKIWRQASSVTTEARTRVRTDPLAQLLMLGFLTASPSPTCTMTIHRAQRRPKLPSVSSAFCWTAAIEDSGEQSVRCPTLLRTAGAAWLRTSQNQQPFLVVATGLAMNQNTFQSSGSTAVGARLSGCTSKRRSSYTRTTAPLRSVPGLMPTRRQRPCVAKVALRTRPTATSATCTEC